MTEGSRFAALEDDDILKKKCFKELFKMEWSYHPLIEDKCQYPYNKERTKIFFLLISSSNAHTWKCISFKK